MWLDGNGDGVAERYYFGMDGYMVSDAVTPDGLLTGSSGAWTVDGVIQTEQTQWVDNRYWEIPVTDSQYQALTEFQDRRYEGEHLSDPGLGQACQEIDPYELACRVTELVNEERAARGRADLKRDEELMEIAVMRAEESDVCAPHTRPDGSGYATAVPGSGYVGENLANMTSGYRDLEQTAQDAVRSWLASPSHKKNILNPRYKSTGVGVWTEGSRMRMVQLFTD